MDRIIIFTINIIIFVLLIGSAFSISPLFAVFFIFAVSYAILTKEITERSVLPLIIFIGAFLMHFAVTNLFLPIFRSQTIIDVGIGILMFGFIYYVGNLIKKPKTKRRYRRR